MLGYQKVLLAYFQAEAVRDVHKISFQNDEEEDSVAWMSVNTAYFNQLVEFYKKNKVLLKIEDLKYVLNGFLETDEFKNILLSWSIPKDKISYLINDIGAAVETALCTQFQEKSAGRLDKAISTSIFEYVLPNGEKLLYQHYEGFDIDLSITQEILNQNKIKVIIQDIQDSAYKKLGNDSNFVKLEYHWGEFNEDCQDENNKIV